MNNQVVIPGNVAQITLCCAEEGTIRFAATLGVQITIGEADGKPTYQAVATDGRRLAIVSGPGLNDIVPRLEADSLGEIVSQAVVPAKHFRAVFGMNEEEDRKAFVALGDKASLLASWNNSSGVVQKRECRNVEGRFPDINNVLPTGKPTATAIIDPALLITLLKIAESVKRDDAGNNLPVTLEIHDSPKKYVVLRAKTVTGQKLTAILVQMERAPGEATD